MYNKNYDVTLSSFCPIITSGLTKRPAFLKILLSPSALRNSSKFSLFSKRHVPKNASAIIKLLQFFFKTVFLNFQCLKTIKRNYYRG